MRGIYKTIFDKLFAISVLFLLLPVILIVLIIVAFETRDFPLITQRRILYLGANVINIYKIRTIITNQIFKKLEDKSSSMFHKSEYKEFVPPFCGLLRKSGFDEIPQLINVLKGEMSLIGPRPFLKKDLSILHKNAPELHAKRANIKSIPGITGYWQLWRNRGENEENLLELDEFYEKNKSFILDVKILLKTAITMLSFNHTDAILRSRSKKRESGIPTSEFVE